MSNSRMNKYSNLHNQENDNSFTNKLRNNREERQHYNKVYGEPKRPNKLWPKIFLVITIIAAIFRFTIFSQGFMETAVKNPIVINPIKTEIKSNLQKNNIPTGIVTNDLIKSVLQTGIKESYQGQSLDFNTPEIYQAVKKDLNQQISNIGLNTSYLPNSITDTATQSFIKGLNQYIQNNLQIVGIINGIIKIQRILTYVLIFSLIMTLILYMRIILFKIKIKSRYRK